MQNLRSNNVSKNPVPTVESVCNEEIDEGGPSDNGKRYPDVPYSDGLMSIEEYCALETVRTVRNFDGIAQARSEKPKRQIEMDQQIPEHPIFTVGSGNVGDDAQVEAAEMRAREGLGSMDQVLRLAHHFEPTTLAEILVFILRSITILSLRICSRTLLCRSAYCLNPKSHQLFGTDKKVTSCI